MSSGLGDVILELLKNDGLLYKNVHVITNLFEFDENGNAISYKEPVIHSMNKHETAIQNFPIFDLIKDKKNIILLGDIIEDVGMIQGFEYDNIIKIGFLKENNPFKKGLTQNQDLKKEENIEKFKEFYDVIIMGEGDMGFVNQLMREIVK